MNKNVRADCRRIIEELASERGAPLRWAEVLPQSRWSRLAAATKKALAPAPAPGRRLWAPAFALAAALMLIWRAVPVPQKAPPEAPAAVLENLEFFEHLELFENWELARALPPQKGNEL